MNPEDSQLPNNSISPDAMLDYKNVQYLPISLSDCITRALSDSEVFRNLGGTLVALPNGIRTIMDPAIAYTDPTFGEDAALSAFDANLVSGLIFENNDRPFNNRFSGNTDGILTQDLGEYSFELTKLSATGSQFTSRSTINYDHNNQAGNRYGHSWQTIIDSEFRQPLLQGAGSLFNRIAGPSRVPGQYNGVLIARTNTEISLAAFEQGVREFVSNVENAYWDLYFGYRELNAQTDARDAAYVVFKDTEAEAGTKRISDLELASAKEQYLRFESAVYESLEGRLIEGTQTNSGSTGGSFRRTAGVRVAERRLRYLIGMPITDGTLLKPSDRPLTAPMVFDWDQSVASALTARPETRRQRWIVKQRELELTAAKNFLLPRFDVVGNYRFRGLGKSLTGGSVTLQDDIANGTDNSAAFSDLASGDFQEVQIGAELRMPVGFRRANAAVRNAELLVQRSRAILKEQERKILLDLSNAIAECRRAHGAMMLAKRRYDAAVDYRKNAALRALTGRSQFDVLLEAQRRILEAQLQYISAEVEYAIALKNVRYEKASFLEYHGIALSESESNPQAYIDNQRRVAARKKEMSYVVRDAVIGLSPVRTVTSVEDAIVVGQGIAIENTTISSDAIQTEISDEMPVVPESPTTAPPLPSPATESTPAGANPTETPLGKTTPNEEPENAEKALANAIALLNGENPADVTEIVAKPEIRSITDATLQSAPATQITAHLDDNASSIASAPEARSAPSTSQNSIGYFANQINLGDEQPRGPASFKLSDTSRRPGSSTFIKPLPSVNEGTAKKSAIGESDSADRSIKIDSSPLVSSPGDSGMTTPPLSTFKPLPLNSKRTPAETSSLPDKTANAASTISVLEAKAQKQHTVAGLTDLTKPVKESTEMRLSDAKLMDGSQESSNRRVR